MNKLCQGWGKMRRTMQHAARAFVGICLILSLISLAACDVARLATGRPNVFTGYDRPSYSNSTSGPSQAAPGSSTSEPNWIPFFTELNNEFKAAYVVDKMDDGSGRCKPDGDGGCVVEVKVTSMTPAFMDQHDLDKKTDYMTVTYGIDCQKRLMRHYEDMYYSPSRFGYSTIYSIKQFDGELLTASDPGSLGYNLFKRFCG